MTVEDRVKALLPGTTFQICDRYVNNHMKDRDHGTPESYSTVYSALRRLERKGVVSKERIFSGNGRWEAMWKEG